MTALETWVIEVVKVLVGDGPEAFEPDWGTVCGPVDKAEASYREDWRVLSQRGAVLLVQARALECRHLAGELAINYGNAMAPLIQSCWDRSHKLEAIAMMLAKQWPIPEGRETMVCRCAISTGEMLADPPSPPFESDAPLVEYQPRYICSNCKLPKKGTAGNGPVLVKQ